MKLKIIIPVTVLVIIVLVFVINRVAIASKVHTTTKDSVISLTPTPTIEALSWDDPAGFSFQYIKGVTIDKHDEDKENYAHIEMTHPDHQGKLIVWAKDTTASDLVTWGKKEKSIASASSIETTLGGIAAKKFSLAVPTKKMIAATITDGIVFLVDADTEDVFWQDQFDMITKTFAFTTDSSSNAASGNSSDETAVDEEEIVE